MFIKIGTGSQPRHTVYKSKPTSQEEFVYIFWGIMKYEISSPEQTLNLLWENKTFLGSCLHSQELYPSSPPSDNSWYYKKISAQHFGNLGVKTDLEKDL